MPVLWQTTPVIVSGLTAAQDWAARKSGPGVVWWSDFETDNEVNAFRWSGSLSNGNDPQALGTNATLCRRINTDGITGNCLEIVRATGTADGAFWWRPLSPFVGGTTTGNGKGAGLDDPGAGTITPQAWTPTQNGSQTNQWARGFWANSAKTGAVPNATFDGNDWYMQCRVKIDTARTATSLNRALSPGKLFFFTRTDLSLTPQELVTESYNPGTNVPTNDYFGMYRSGGTELWQDTTGTNQVGSDYNQNVGDKTCQLNNNGGREANCWNWPLGQWCTILYHIVEGTASALDGVSSDNNTGVTVWVAKPGETAYTKIWDQPGVKLPFDHQWGHNGIICGTYMNGANMNQFYHRYCQMIFSKNTIPCPQV